MIICHRDTETQRKKLLNGHLEHTKMKDTTTAVMFVRGLFCLILLF